MPEGSSSAAPVMRPGPRSLKNFATGLRSGIGPVYPAGRRAIYRYLRWRRGWPVSIPKPGPLSQYQMMRRRKKQPYPTTVKRGFRRRNRIFPSPPPLPLYDPPSCLPIRCVWRNRLRTIRFPSDGTQARKTAAPPLLRNRGEFSAVRQQTSVVLRRFCHKSGTYIRTAAFCICILAAAKKKAHSGA